MSWEEEQESHLAMRAEMNERAGMSPEEARRAAERAFGNRAQTGEAVRAVSIPLWWEQLGQDLRYAWRGLGQAPAFTLTAVAALAVGIGTATAVFSFVDRILFRPLPYAHEEQLVWFGMTAPIGDSEFIVEQNYAAWRKQATPFAAIGATGGVSDCSLTEENPAKLACARVTANYLEVLGYRPQAGRDFRPEDAQVGAPQTALVSRALWQARFGGAPLREKYLEIDGNRTQVVGVLPATFEMPSLTPVDVLQVLQLDENQPASAPTLLMTAMARLRPGVSVDQARTQMEPFFQQALQGVPPGFRKEVRFVIHPLRDRQVRDSARAARFLLGAVMLVLLIAVANVANLLLARTSARRRELAVRAAIGASRGRLARQALTESLLLGGLGGASGVALAAGLLTLFRELAPEGMARLAEATIDWRIAGFAVAVTAVASVLFGAGPAWQSPVAGMLTGGRVAGVRREWLRPGLVVAQIALSLMLLCGAALLLESLRNMARAPLGMETTALISAQAQLPDGRYGGPESRAAFWKGLTERVAALPGVAAVGLADSLPPQERAQMRIFSSIHVAGQPRQQGRPTGGMVIVRQVSPSYFGLLKIPVRQGRVFADGEEQTVVLSERMAARMFPGENPVGRKIVLTGEATVEVTGVVREVRNGGLTEPSVPEIYLPSKRDRSREYVLLRADTRVMPLVREAFRQADPRLTVELATLDERVRSMRTRPQFQSMLLVGFALAGLVLAAIGLYGVMALLTVQRSGEIGVRLALGATAANIRGLVLGQAVRWAAVGLAIGLAGAAASARLIDGLLYEVKASAPGPLAGAATVLLLTVVFAAWVPARRASRVAPVEALREL